MKYATILEIKIESVLAMRYTHNQDRNPNEYKAKQVVHQIKVRAQYSKPTVAVAMDLSEISDD